MTLQNREYFILGDGGREREVRIVPETEPRYSGSRNSKKSSAISHGVTLCRSDRLAVEVVF